MKRIIATGFALLLLGLFIAVKAAHAIAASAWVADIQSQSLDQANQVIFRGQLYYKDGKIRVDRLDGSLQQIFLLDPKRREMLILLPERFVYLEISLNEIWDWSMFLHGSAGKVPNHRLLRKTLSQSKGRVDGHSCQIIDLDFTENEVKTHLQTCISIEASNLPLEATLTDSSGSKLRTQLINLKSAALDDRVFMLPDEYIRITDL